MQWKKALSSLVEMREAGIKANSFVYSAAIDACAKVSQPISSASPRSATRDTYVSWRSVCRLSTSIKPTLTPTASAAPNPTFFSPQDYDSHQQLI